MNGGGIIFNADDFGLSCSVNSAVLRAHRDGVLTSASLMVGGDAFDDAVDRARRCPTLYVGLHLVCIDGKAVLPPSEIPNIVDADARFGANPVAVGVRYFFSQKARTDLRREIRAQFERFINTGLPLHHVDGHWHYHMHPAIFPYTYELAREFGATRIRVPRDPLMCGIRRNQQRIHWKLITALEFYCLNVRAVRFIRRHGGLTTTDWVYGLLETGAMSEQTLLRILRSRREGSIEVYTHPDESRSESSPNGPEELNALLSEEIKRAAGLP